MSFSTSLEHWLLERMVVGSFEGIKIVGCGDGKKDRDFLPQTVAALQLIRSVDPRRFRRVQREIVYLENTFATAFASYHRALKSCRINYLRLRAHYVGGDEWHAWSYAMTLVHEATHGAVYSRQIRYTKELRLRIERLCWSEENRFALKADAGGRQWSEVLVSPLEEDWLHTYWNANTRQRLKWGIEQIREYWRS